MAGVSGFVPPSFLTEAERSTGGEGAQVNMHNLLSFYLFLFRNQYFAILEPAKLFGSWACSVFFLYLRLSLICAVQNIKWIRKSNGLFLVLWFMG